MMIIQEGEEKGQKVTNSVNSINDIDKNKQYMHLQQHHIHRLK